MVVVTDLNKKKKGTRDKAYGEDPYQGTLGITKEDDFKNDAIKPSPFVAKQKDNADIEISIRMPQPLHVWLRFHNLSMTICL